VTRRTIWAVAVTAIVLAAHLTACAAEEEPVVAAVDRGPALGAEAPGFTLEALDGREVSLAGLTAEGPVVLVFFRGAW
jgi:cytochrome oxidase Cu insertion factor (SCO1/SenC/PrrC family)